MLALHKYRVEGELVYLLSDGNEVRTLDDKQFKRFVNKLEPGEVILSTTANPTDAILMELSEHGAKLVSAHWHATGIAKGLPPEGIVKAFAQLPENLLRPLTVRKDIQELKAFVNMRHALVEYRKAAQLKLSAIGRAAGAKVPAFLEETSTELKAEAHKEETPLEKKIKTVAKDIPECVVLHSILGMKDAWLSVAKIIAEIQDPHRFPMVSSLWHYAGLHGPVKRERGKASDWNAKLKCSLWQLVDAGLKNNVPTFRQPYDAKKAAEAEVHEVKHPKCKTPEGHCGAMARRVLMKDFLREFWVACSSQNMNENRVQGA